MKVEESILDLRSNPSANTSFTSGLVPSLRRNSGPKSQPIFEAIIAQIPIFGSHFSWIGRIIDVFIPSADTASFLGRNMKSSAICLSLLLLKLVIITSLSLFFAASVFVFCYLYFAYPLEFVTKIPLQKGEQGVSSLFFLQSESASKNTACSPRSWSYSTFPPENLEILEQACQYHEKTAKINSIELEPYSYIAEVVLDLPDSEGNKKIEFLELRMNIVDSTGKSKTFYSSGTHVTSGNSIMRTMRRMVSQQMDQVYFNTQTPILKNEEYDLLMLKMDIWEPNLVVEEAMLLLRPVISNKIRYYMTYYFWVFGVLVASIVFWWNFCCFGVLVFGLELFLRWAKGAKKNE